MTLQAVALNTARPTRQQQAEHEQPGCVHASMDLFKYAAKLHPHLPSSLLADTLELAIAARVLDMRASPYDLRAVDTPGFDLRAVRVETAEGRREYQLEQAAVARRAAPLRRQLLHHYDAALDAVAKPAEPAAGPSTAHCPWSARPRPCRRDDAGAPSRPSQRQAAPRSRACTA